MREKNRIEIKVHNTIENADHQAWNSIRDPGNLLTDVRFLKALEAGNEANTETIYFEFYSQQTLLVTMAGFTYITDFISYLPGVLRIFVGVIRKFSKGFLRMTTLEISSPLNSGLTISINSQTTKSQLDDVIKLFLEYARENQIKFLLFRDFEDLISTFEVALGDAGFSRLNQLPTAKMEINWNSFEDYLVDLKKRWRQDVKRKFRYFKKLNVQTNISNDIDSMESIPKFVQLYRNILRKNRQLDRDFYGFGYHRTCSEIMNGEAYWLKYSIQDEVVAFSQIFVYNNQIFPVVLGLDYDKSNTAMLYFNMYYDWLRFAIDRKVSSFDAGPTTYEAKSGIGFSIFPQRLYLRMDNLFLLKLIAFGFNIYIKSQLENCHYAFKDDKHQTFNIDKNKLLTD